MPQDNQFPQLQLNPQQVKILQSYYADALTKMAGITFQGPDMAALAGAAIRIIFQQGRLDMVQTLLSHDQLLEEQQTQQGT